MKRPVTHFLLKLLLLVLPVIAGFELLYRLSIYPVLTNSLLFDYKMLEAQRHPPGEVKLLAMGSSVTLYDLDSRLIRDGLGVSYHNFASWGMQVTDIGAALRALVKEYHPSYVLMCSSPRDFMFHATGSYADFAGTPAFFRERFPEYFYIRNYSPIHSLYIRRFHSRRPHLDASGGASIDEMWEGVVRDDKDEHLDFPTAYTEMQYRSLESLCAFLRAEKVRLIFAQGPMEERYTNTAARKQSLAAHFERCRGIVAAQGFDYFDYYDNAVFPDSLFADLTHLSKAGQVVLTGRIVADLTGIVK